MPAAFIRDATPPRHFFLRLPPPVFFTIFEPFFADSASMLAG